MYKFGKSSEDRLLSVHPDLVAVCRKMLSYSILDATVVQGRRSKEDQDRAFKEGKSKLKYPQSRHNSDPSEAVDIAPFVNGKVSWNTQHCLVLAGLMLAAASELGIKVRWGGNWDRDGEPVTDQTFNDLVHFELDK